MDKCNFYVGQKVVCINGKREFVVSYIEKWELKQGAIYTVSGILPPEPQEPYFGITLEEIPLPNNPMGWRCGFFARRFRPIAHPKTDISIFQRILADVTASNVKEVSADRQAICE